MKKILFILLVLFCFTGCIKVENKDRLELGQEEKGSIIENKKEECEIDQVKNEVTSFEHGLEFENGRSIGFSSIGLNVFNGETMKNIVLTSYSKDQIIKIFSNLQYKEVLDLNKDAYNYESINISLGNNSYFQIILDKKNADGFYIANYFENGSYKGQVVSKESIKKQVLESLVEGYIINNEIHKYFSNLGTQIPVVIADYIGSFFEDDKFVVLSNVKNINYSFDNGLYSEESGFVSSVEIDFVANENGDYDFEEIKFPKDGEMFLSSLYEMARDNEEIVTQLIDSQSSIHLFYDQIMEKLSEKSNELGLRNFSHKLEEVPGYESNVIYIEEGPNYIENTIEIANKDEYFKVKETGSEENWPHVEGVIFHRPTGLAVKGIIDYFDLEN